MLQHGILHRNLNFFGEVIIFDKFLKVQYFNNKIIFFPDMLESSIAEWEEMGGIKAKVISQQSAAHGINNPDL